MFDLLEELFENEVFMILVMILVFAIILYQTKVFEKAFAKLNERLDAQGKVLNGLKGIDTNTKDEKVSEEIKEHSESEDASA